MGLLDWIPVWKDVSKKFSKVPQNLLKMTVEIYGILMSAPVRAVAMTADQIGCDYELKTIDLMKGENMTEEYLKINPQHNIPALKDGDFCLNESRAIMMYLANAYDKENKLYPVAPKVRARVDQRLFFDMGTFYKAIGDLMYPHLFGRPMEDEETKQKKFKEVMGWANDFVKPTGWVAGNDCMTLADIAFAATYGTAKATGAIKNHDKTNQVGLDAFAGWVKAKWA